MSRRGATTETVTEAFRSCEESQVEGILSHFGGTCNAKRRQRVIAGRKQDEANIPLVCA